MVIFEIIFIKLNGNILNTFRTTFKLKVVYVENVFIFIYFYIDNNNNNYFIFIVLVLL